jgi:malonyl-CoA O-methyltransferase
MLERCTAKQGACSKTRVLHPHAMALPFADQSIDVVFSNLLLPWLDDPARLAAEVGRILRKDGLFFFSSLGPDSLLALRNAWRAIDEQQHVNRFLDMHDLGDALVQAGLRDPVLDVDRLSVTYEDADSLFHDLTAAGGRNALQGRARGMLGKARFAALRNGLEAARKDGRIHLDLELVYGHCWGSGVAASGGDVRINPGSISVRRR